MTNELLFVLTWVIWPLTAITIVVVFAYNVERGDRVLAWVERTVARAWKWLTRFR